MALKFHKLKVKQKVQETSDALSLIFDLPSELKSEYDYKPGQYLTLRFFINNKDERRAYSFASSPHYDSDIKVTIKEVKNGIISNHISNNIKIGDMIDVMTPTGNFTAKLDEKNSKNYIFFAGGSGITPIISLIKSILKIEKDSVVSLVYGNKDYDSIIFKKDLQSLILEFGNRLSVIHILDELKTNFESAKGLISEKFCVDFLNNNNNFLQSIYYLCGPSGFIDIVENTLIKLKIENKLIHKESFTVSNKTENKIKAPTPSSPEFGTESKLIKIVLYGEEIEVEVKEEETIIEACQRAGLEPPYSCCVGACSTCISKLESGKVEMDDDMALTDEEKEEGLILACTSHPMSDDVKIDFDYY